MPQQEEKKEKNTSRSFFFEVAKTVLIAFAIVIVVRYFLFQPFYVKGQSMEPNFEDHQYLVIDEISYRLRAPERGEVVVLRYPRDPSQFFIKRLVGLPGETVSIRDNSVTITPKDGGPPLLLDETYLASGAITGGNLTMKLGENEFFVLGDNRSASLDSRSFGIVPRKNLVGRVWIRVWPFDLFTVFSSP